MHWQKLTPGLLWLLMAFSIMINGSYMDETVEVHELSKMSFSCFSNTINVKLRAREVNMKLLSPQVKIMKTFAFIALLLVYFSLPFAFIREHLPNIGEKNMARLHVKIIHCFEKWNSFMSIGDWSKWVLMPNTLKNSRKISALLPTYPQKDSYAKMFGYSDISDIYPFTRLSITVAPATMDQYFRDSAKEGVTREELMKYEWERYKSFENFPVKSPAMPVKLASAGYYWSGVGDEVICFSCKHKHNNWKQCDVAFEVHKKLSPNCPFINGKEGTNVPIHDANDRNTSKSAAHAASPGGACGHSSGGKKVEHQAHQEDHWNDAPKHPEYTILNLRLSSYKQFPTIGGQDPKILAAAGFYYLGFGDCVRCFHCGLGLRNWQYGDTPWKEHAHWGPNCRFLLQKKGPGFVQYYQRQLQAESNAPSLQVSGCDKATDGACPKLTPKGSSSVDGAQSRKTPGTVDIPKLLEMGYSKDTISRTMKRLQQVHRRSNLNTEDVLEAILFDDVNHLSTQTEIQQLKSAKAEVQAKDFSKPKSNQSEKRKVPEKTEDKLACLEMDAPSIAEENRQLQQQLTCKICMDKDACIVFLPCGHMITCPTCAPALRNCAICRQRIKGTVKAFMS